MQEKSPNRELPSVYQITPEPSGAPQFSDFLAQLDRTLSFGTTLLQLRAKQLNSIEYLLLAKETLNCCRRHGTKLLLNAPVELARQLDSDGVHLDSRSLMNCHKRPLGKDKLVSAACHDAEQLRRAETIDVDFVTVSPVLQTATHPDAIPLGWEVFAELVSQTKTPVYALGGMNSQTLARAMQAGAYGIAVIRALWDYSGTGLIPTNNA